MDLFLIIPLAALLVFMFWSSRRRMKKQKDEQAAKARQTVPGVEVLLQGGLYGTIVEYDPEDLDKPALIELAPGVQVKVHSQAILRVVDPVADVTEDDFIDGEVTEDDYSEVASNDDISPLGDDLTRDRTATADSEADNGTDSKPKA
jgi:preprotein translocase subunit YajC